MPILPSTKTVHAALRGAAAPVKGSGNGTIRLTDNGALLQIGNENIPVVLPDKPPLEDGQSVRFTVAGDTIQITPHPGKTPPAAEMPTELLTLSQANEAAPLPPSTTSPVVFTVSSPEPGIYLFSSIEEIGKATGTIPDPETLRQLKETLATDGVVALRISPADNGTFLAKTWPLEDIPLILGQLTGSQTGNFFSSLSTEVLTQLLFDRGALPFEPLMQLDRLFSSIDLPFPEVRAGSADAQKQAVLQWLHSALSTDLTSAGTFALAPITSAGTMVTDLEPIFAALTTSSPSPIPSAGSYALAEVEQSTQSNPSSRPLIETMGEQMGYTLERTLTSEAANTVFTPRQTLKSFLLHLLQTVANTEDTIGVTTAQKANFSPSAPPLATLPQSTAPDLFPANFSGKLTTALNQLSKQLTPLLLTVTSHPSPTTTPSTTGTTSGVGNPISHSLPLKDSGSSLPPASPGKDTPVGVSPGVRELLDEAMGLLDRSHDQSSTTRAASEPVPALLVKTQQLRELLHALAAELSHNNPIGTVPITDRIRTLAHAALETIKELFENGASNRTEDPAVRGEMVSRTRAAVATDRSVEAQPPSLMHSPASLARALGTALDRLESLQLLAREVPTTQGTRQIIALPIRFGEIWTEINVRFLHQKKKKRAGKRSGQVSVAIDVAPPALGGLSAHLQYTPSRELRATVAFERSNTRKWFSLHQSELQQALLQTGMKTVHLELSRKHSPSVSRKRQHSTDSDTLIDMKV